jgi:hypothetical protein
VINYSCHTCGEPMKVSIHFMTYIKSNGAQKQHCVVCGAIHQVNPDQSICLTKSGAMMARLSQEYDYPEYKPYRPGPYRVRYANGNWSKSYVTWNGDAWHNGPVFFRDGSIVAWQGLAGDMEHLKRMPYEHDEPLPHVMIAEDES